MLNRQLEPEVMDTDDDAEAYDTMDHAAVNRCFVDDLVQRLNHESNRGCDRLRVLDLGTGTAQQPIVLCDRHPSMQLVAVDAADAMLRIARQNLQRADCQQRVALVRCDAKQLPFADHSFDAVISNSIVHHIPDPLVVFGEAVRATRPGGTLFFRDLLRPPTAEILDSLVAKYTAGETDQQQQLFADSLRAALTIQEVVDIVASFGCSPETVRQTSDRHWTWAATRVV